MVRRTQMHLTFDESVVFKNKGKFFYKNYMHELISGAHGLVYLSKEPLICIRGKEVGDQPDLGYQLYDDCDIFPFLELRSAAVWLKKVDKSVDSARLMRERI